jgi:Putative Flp pilus-assembly TadE/G-like
MNTGQGARGERGAITIHVAIALIALLAFCSFVVDYGLMWVSRRQAQNAADAAALAGAISLVRDGGGALTSAATVKVSAETFAVSNAIWGQANVSGRGGNVIVAVSGTGAGEESVPPCNTDRGCVRVDVLRNQPPRGGGAPVGAPLPTFFASIVGISEQGVRATATAQVVPGNAARCLRPFAIPDLYIEVTPPVDEFGGGDTYVAPSATSAGTGHVATDFGTALLLEPIEPKMTPGAYRRVELMGGGLGGTARTKTRACGTDVYGIGDPLVLDATAPDLAGITVGIQDLMALDPLASWDPVGREILNSCVETRSCYTYDATGNALITDADAVVSPRLITLPIIDPSQAALNNITIVNIIGFFITSVAGPGEVHGVLMTEPGLLESGKGRISSASAFLNVVKLVR